MVAAFDTFGEIFFGEGFVLGGANNVTGVNVDDSPDRCSRIRPAASC